MANLSPTFVEPTSGCLGHRLAELNFRCDSAESLYFQHSDEVGDDS